jgi:hypothetical protein
MRPPLVAILFHVFHETRNTAGKMPTLPGRNPSITRQSKLKTL